MCVINLTYKLLRSLGYCAEPALLMLLQNGEHKVCQVSQITPNKVY